jgi:hypothetical protein
MFAINYVTAITNTLFVKYDYNKIIYIRKYIKLNNTFRDKHYMRVHKTICGHVNGHGIPRPKDIYEYFSL